VDLHGKRLVYLGRDVPAPRREALPVRMLLLGAGWTLPAFAAAVRMGQVQEDPAGRRREAVTAWAWRAAAPKTRPAPGAPHNGFPCAMCRIPETCPCRHRPQRPSAFP